MQQALSLAGQAEGRTSPNPAVGAVVVKDGKIVGRGFHRKAGGPHAEVEALDTAGEEARGATLYVTLEPCNHHGRTPPCTEAIIDAGITEVFYAVGDPNPGVVGRGHERLIEDGITVHQGLCEDEARHLNRFFFHFIRERIPYVIAKYAASLDGKIATWSGQSQWITGPAARQKGQSLRQMVDAVVIGAGTALADDPRLTVRMPGEEIRHPLRVVLDSRGRVPLEAKLYQPGLPGQTVVAATDAMPSMYRAALEKQGVDTLIAPASKEGRVDLSAVLTALAERKVMSLMVEGGSEVLGAFFESGLVNEVWAFLAPMIIGGTDAPGPVGGSGFSTLAQACRLSGITTESIEDDVLIRGYIN